MCRLFDKLALDSSGPSVLFAGQRDAKGNRVVDAPFRNGAGILGSRLPAVYILEVSLLVRSTKPFVRICSARHWKQSAPLKIPASR